MNGESKYERLILLVLATAIVMGGSIFVMMLTEPISKAGAHTEQQHLSLAVRSCVPYQKYAIIVDCSSMTGRDTFKVI
jgi:uncharacterized membrane protein